MSQLPALPPLPETEWNLHMPARQYECEWTSSEYGYTSDQMLEYANQYAALAVAAAVPPGFAVVPIEPTEKMKEAAMVTYIEAKLADWGMWKAMLEAAQEQKT